MRQNRYFPTTYATTRTYSDINANGVICLISFTAIGLKSILAFYNTNTVLMSHVYQLPTQGFYFHYAGCEPVKK